MRQLAVLFALFAVACSEKPAGTEPVVSAIELTVPALAGSAEPNLATGADDTVVLSWLEPAGEAHALRFAVLEEDGWSTPLTVAQSSNWFINWADFPSVVPVAQDLWAAHWLQKTPGSVYSYDVRVATSTDRGRTWDESITPHNDGTSTEHGFVSLFADTDGFGVVWLDGRKTAGQEHAEDAHDTSSIEHGMTLRAAVVNRDNGLSSEQEIDGLVCDCCQTDVAMTSAGPIVAYRNRSADEIRDIYVSRNVDGRWQEGTPVAVDNWQIGGCPVNGPAIAAQGERVVVAWFTAANGVSRTKLAFSTDTGATFSEPVVVDSGKVLGRVGISMLPDGSAAISWMKNIGEGRAEIRLQKINASGFAGPIKVIARTSAARISGFPQLLATRHALLLAWTDVTNGIKTVRSTTVAFSALE